MPAVLQQGMYHETFHQVYGDKIDMWVEQQAGPRLRVGDYYWKNGQRTIIVWRSVDGYVPTVLAFRVYDNDNDFREYGAKGIFEPVDCNAR